MSPEKLSATLPFKTERFFFDRRSDLRVVMTNRRCEARLRDGESGVSMVATLVVVIILGTMLTLVLSHSPSPTTNPVVPGGTSEPTPAPSAPATANRVAAVAACRVDYAEVLTAISEYRATHGSAPPSGTAWATSGTSTTRFLQSWPTDARLFSLAWNGTSLNVIPFHGTTSVASPGSPSTKSGCFAI